MPETYPDEEPDLTAAELKAMLLKAFAENRELRRENTLLTRNIATLNAIIGNMDKQFHPEA